MSLSETEAMDIVETPSASSPNRVWASLRSSPLAVIALSVIIIWSIVGLTIDLWAPYDPLSQAGDRLQPPNGEHWFGTDTLGRDIFTRTMYGVRYSLPLALIVIFFTVLIGTLVGMLAG